MAKAYHLRGTSNKLPNTRNRSRIHRNPVGTPNSSKKLSKLKEIQNKPNFKYSFK